MLRNRPARVLMLVENCSYPRDVRVRREAETLAEAGCEVSVICPALKGQVRRERLNGVRVVRYVSPPEARGTTGLRGGVWLLVAGYADFDFADCDARRY